MKILFKYTLLLSFYSSFNNQCLSHNNDSLKTNLFKQSVLTKNMNYLSIIDSVNKPVIINKIHLLNYYKECCNLINIDTVLNKMYDHLLNNKNFAYLSSYIPKQAYHSILPIEDSLYLGIDDSHLITTCFEENRLLKDEYSIDKRKQYYIIYKLILKNYLLFNDCETGIIYYVKIDT